MTTINFWWQRLFWPSPMSFGDIFWPLPKIGNGDNQWMPPYIRINSDDSQRSITINHCYWYEMVTIIVHHYSHYSWWTLNVTTTPILLVMWLSVTVNECHHIYAPIVVVIKDPSQEIIIVHMKWWQSLSVIIINNRDRPWMWP